MQQPWRGYRVQPWRCIITGPTCGPGSGSPSKVKVLIELTIQNMYWTSLILPLRLARSRALEVTVVQNVDVSPGALEPTCKIRKPRRLPRDIAGQNV